MRHLVISESEANLRLDKALSELCSDLSRSQISFYIKEGKALVNGNIEKPSYITKEGDEIDLEEVEKMATLEKEDIDIDIIYEDDDIIIVNKPQGMVTHPGVGNNKHTLANALAYHSSSLSDINGEFRPGIVHRLDKDTSGLLCVAKNDTAHLFLSAELLDHTMKRTYLALVRGNIKENKAKIDLPIGKDKKSPMKYAVTRDGKPSVTYFEVLKRYKTHTLIKCELETGRTHQIRVHLAYLGYPVESDPLYGEKNAPSLNPNGQCLHAYQLELVHPTTKEVMTFNAPIPQYFLDILSKLEEI